MLKDSGLISLYEIVFCCLDLFDFPFSNLTMEEDFKSFLVSDELLLYN